MNPVRCTAGHFNHIDFEDEMQKPCPNCAVSVFKFRDHCDPEGDPKASTVEAPAAARKPPLSKEAAKKIGILVIGAALLIGVWIAKRPIPELPKGTADAVLPGPVAADTNSSAIAPAPVAATLAPPSTDLAKVHIRNLKILAMDGDNVRVQFTLANDGQPTSFFPALQVEWTGSAQPALRLDSTSYSHPAEFTQVEVTTEFVKPADATGLTISVKG